MTIGLGKFGSFALQQPCQRANEPKAHLELGGCFLQDHKLCTIAGITYSLVDGWVARETGEKPWVERGRSLTSIGPTAINSGLAKSTSATWTYHFCPRPAYPFANLTAAGSPLGTTNPECLNQIFRLTEGNHTVLSFIVAL